MLKDWQKTTRSNGSITFKKDEKNVYVLKSNNGWFVSSDTTGFRSLKGFIDKTFKTKTSALKYARSYMRKH